MTLRHRRLDLQFRFSRLRRGLSGIGRWLRPAAATWRAATLALWMVVLVALVYQGVALLLPGASLWTGLTVLLLSALVLLVGWLLRQAVALLAAWPGSFQVAVFAAVATVLLLVGPSDDPALWALFGGLFLLGPVLLGAGVAVLLRTGPLLARVAGGLGALLGVACLSWLLGWWFSTGVAGGVALPERGATPFMALSGPGPGVAGEHEVLAWTYGSGTDRHRQAFAADARFTTAGVDGRPFIDGWEGRAGHVRTDWWGFDAAALPLQGRVWQPVGPGPWPLVLVVHGNHGMEAFSDPGYAWLGKHLASRGHVVVSIDQNFLNGSVADSLGFPDDGLDEENDARGWLLLEHLAQWRRWSGDPEHPLAGLVDLDRVALVGHSRGGEAAAVAALFNRLARYPGDATVAFDYGFGIQAVVALAPVDGQYLPGGQPTPLRDLDYLVLHGGMDGDVTSFSGLAQWHRVAWSGGAPWRFKAALWIPEANHGEFNTVWGALDAPPPYHRLLNLDPLLSGAEQRQVAAVAISGFLAASLAGDRGALSMFLDPRAGVHWLPDTQLLARVAGSQQQLLAGFEEDLDPTTGAQGAAVDSAGLAVWREEELALAWAGADTRVAVLGWQAEDSAGPPWWRLRPATPLLASEGDLLLLDLAALDEPIDDTAAGAAADGGSDAAQLDMELVLADGAGHVARVALNRFAPLAPQPRRPVAKPFPLGAEPDSEPVLQTWVLPLRWFRRANPRLDLADLREVRIEFIGAGPGVVALDDLRLVPAASPLAVAVSGGG